MHMNSNLLSSSIVGACLTAGTLLSSAQDNTEPFYFWRLGHMDGPHVLSKALGISRDGKVAVGVTDVVSFMHAWRCDIDWALSTESDGIPPLYHELMVQEDIGAVAPSGFSAAYAASNMTSSPAYDLSNGQIEWGGSLPVGTLTIGKVSYGAQWVELEGAVGYVGIPDFGGGLADMQSKDVSSDGTVMVGFGNNKRGQIGFRADLTDPLQPVLRTLSITDPLTGQTLQSSSAEALSADGTIIAGFGATKTGNRAFVTTGDFLPDPPTLESTILPILLGGMFAEAYTMTPDGAVIAGRSDSPKGPQACIWFKNDSGVWVIKGLGGLSKRKLNSVAKGVAYRPGSPVGELIVVGKSATIQEPEEAFVWTGNPDVEEAGYIYTLEYILIHTGAGEDSLMGSRWVLKDATGISADGTRIVGWGVNPEGGVEAYLVNGFPFGELIFTH
jgi:uncharacterized membrane protein